MYVRDMKIKKSVIQTDLNISTDYSTKKQEN